MNSELYNNKYKIPEKILKHIQFTLISNPSGEGVKRAKFILKNGYLTYQELKRLKNYFDYFDKSKDNIIQYNLAGGDLMRSFIESTLNSERVSVKRSREIKRDITTNVNSELNPYKTPRINHVELNENKEELKKNAVAIIVNKDNKILLLKRSLNPNQWMPGKWALVGGGIEKGETPEVAIKREIGEEIGINVNDLTFVFSIQRFNDSIEYLFGGKYGGDPLNITLNDEHTNFGWFDISEINYLDTVPHLIEYVTIAFKKY